MKVITFVLILGCLLVAQSRGNKCDCRRAKSKETTRIGGNEWVVSKEPGVHEKIEGIVEMPSPELQDDVLVEVFDNPDYLLCEWKPNNPNRCTTNPSIHQRRLGACRTAKDGKFCFTNIPAGSYELRVSKDQGWSPTHIYVEIDSKNPKATKQPIEVSLKIGI